MLKLFVYYRDGYDEEGIESFDTREQAADFISARMARATYPNLANYTVIEGQALQIRALEYASRLELFPD